MLAGPTIYGLVVIFSILMCPLAISSPGPAEAGGLATGFPGAEAGAEPLGAGAELLGALGAGAALGAPPATSINLSTSSCEELISKFTCGCSKSGTFTVPLISAAVARSATNCASSFPPDNVNLPVRNAMGSFQPLRARVTPERFDSD